jgi:hypothetical protein
MELCVILHPVFQQDWKQKKESRKNRCSKITKTKND